MSLLQTQIIESRRSQRSGENLCVSKQSFSLMKKKIKDMFRKVNDWGENIKQKCTEENLKNLFTYQCNNPGQVVSGRPSVDLEHEHHPPASSRPANDTTVLFFQWAWRRPSGLWYARRCRPWRWAGRPTRPRAASRRRPHGESETATSRFSSRRPGVCRYAQLCCELRHTPSSWSAPAKKGKDKKR